MKYINLVMIDKIMIFDTDTGRCFRVMHIITRFAIQYITSNFYLTALSLHANEVCNLFPFYGDKQYNQ